MIYLLLEQKNRYAQLVALSLEETSHVDYAIAMEMKKKTERVARLRVYLSGFISTMEISVFAHPISLQL
jgi:hypothetical protein